jgi:hypothetical protein
MRWIMVAALSCLATLAEGAVGWRLGLGTMVPLDEPPTVTVERRWGGYNVRVYNFSAEPLMFSGYVANTPLMLWETRVNGVWEDRVVPSCVVDPPPRSFVLPPDGRLELRFPGSAIDTGRRAFAIFRSADGSRSSLVLLCDGSR